MPGTNFKNIGVKYRPIKSELKSRRIVLEPERVIRWPFLKALREGYPKSFYPEINPYVEAYQVRDNMCALFEESMDGAGDLWMYVIEGPEKIMIIDTGFGVGDLKGLVQKLVSDPEKKIFVANTHNHYDHAYGNAQFDECYCSIPELHIMRTKNNEHVWDYLTNEEGKGIWTEFDKNDIIEFKPWEPIGVENGHLFDLGKGYLVEAVYLTGHTPGQCAYFDHVNKDIFIGDANSCGAPKEGEPFGENYTVQAKRDQLRLFKPRFAEVNGVFPGHGMIDQPNKALYYLLDACEWVCEHPDWVEEKRTRKNPDGKETLIYTKYIQEGSTLRFNRDFVYYDDSKKKQVLGQNLKAEDYPD
ncbi:MAG: MBL fold metallo-hydrolase [Erysipelotrichaceae bacterium]|nr:MBL fold metallo-hydrolase [Erysipelotrichaceae bacterium]